MSVVVGVLGDIYLSRTDPADPFAQVGLSRADLWFANLEAPLAGADHGARQHRAWTKNALNMDPDMVRHLRDITAVSVANNHALDYGHEAYLASIARLDGAGIGHAGGGADVAAARAPFCQEVGGLRIMLLAYTCLYQDGWSASETAPGMATVRVHTTYEAPPRVFEQPGWPPVVHTYVDPDDKRQVASEIEAARRAADFVVVSFHWGLSTGTREVIEYQEELGRAAIDAGAGAVFGHHPHSLQPLSIHAGRPLLFSLGNIVFDYDRAWRGDNATVAVRLHVDDGRVTRLGLIPLMRDERGNPARANDQVAHAIVDRILAGVEPGTRLEPRWTSAECTITIPKVGLQHDVLHAAGIPSMPA